MRISDCDFVSVVKVKTEREFTHFKEMFLEYAISIEFNLNYQNFLQELANLSTVYSSPSGTGFLLTLHGITVGSVAIRKVNHDFAVIRLFFIRPGSVSSRIKKMLLESAVEWAIESGMKNVYLTPDESMVSAIKVIRESGFKEEMVQHPKSREQFRVYRLDIPANPVLSGAIAS